METTAEFLAPCGLYCGVCGVLYATRDNNEPFLEKLLGVYQRTIPGLEHLKKDDLRCEGCLSKQVSYFCRYCAIKDCTVEKGIEGCHQCTEFPCEHIHQFPMPVGKRVILRSIPCWRDYGTEEWVRKEEARYLCPECGHKLFRGARRCNRCKTAVDLD